MSPEALVAFVVIALLLWEVQKRLVQQHCCAYCGKYKGHEAGCPYNITDRKSLWDSKKR